MESQNTKATKLPATVIASKGLSICDFRKQKEEDHNTDAVVPKVLSQDSVRFTPVVFVQENQSSFGRGAEDQTQKLETVRTSVERLIKSLDFEAIEKHAASEWAEISLLVSQAQAADDPSIGIETFHLAESRIRQLQADIPQLKSLDDLRVLLIRKDFGSYLQQLAATEKEKPQLAKRLAEHWQEIDNWTNKQWLELINESLFDLSPDDGGFADVYHALADFQADLEDANGADKSSETAWSHSFRMTDPTRAAESALRSVQRYARNQDYPQVAKRLSKVSQELVLPVGDLSDKMRLFSEVGKISQNPQGRQTVVSFVEKYDRNYRSYLRGYWGKIYECRIEAENKSPAEIRSLCVSVPKYNGSRGFQPFAANTMTYAYAAVAAARTKNQSAFWEALLLAESQQLDETGVEPHHQSAQTALVEADLRKGNVFRALMTAMNMSDEKTRARVLLPLLADFPEAAPAFIDLDFIKRAGTLDQGCVAISKMFPAFNRELGSRAEVVDWIYRIPSGSIRSAALIAFARSHLLPQRRELSPPIANRNALDVSDFLGMLQNAESDVALIQEPYDRAWGYLWIALCWKKLDQPGSYLASLEKSHDEIKSCWARFWKEFSAPRRRGYKRYGVPREHQPLLEQITKYYTTLAELQAFHLGEPRAAIENAIFAARSTHPLNGHNAETRSRLWIVTEAIRQDCGIKTHVMESVYSKRKHDNYHHALMLANQDDLQGLIDVTKVMQSPKASINFLTRALAEAAILAAKQGDLDGYRDFRRKAVGNIQSKNASNLITLPLHEADAFANEFNLAKKGANSNTFLHLYGPSAKVAAALCGTLSLANRTADAMKLLPSADQPFFRIQAVHSIAACRSKTLPSTQLLQWVDSLQPLDRVSAICGIAYPEPMPLK